MNKLIHGDALQELDKLIAQGVKVDAIITDPPYKIQEQFLKNDKNGGIYNNKNETVNNNLKFKTLKYNSYLNKFYNILNDKGHLYLMTNDFNLLEALLETKKAGFHITKTLIWKKPNKIVCPYYMTNKEYIIFARKGKAKKLNLKGISDVIETPNWKKTKINNKNIHTTEKPIELMKLFIANSTNENEIVLDCFMGSGTTGVASKNLNRQFIGIEKEKKYFDIANERINHE